MARSEDRVDLARFRYVPAAVIFLTLAILGTTIFLAHHYFRNTFREQIARRDAEILYALWASHQESDPAAHDLDAMIDDPWDQFAAVMRISRLLKGVLATRLLDERGGFIAAGPEHVSEGKLGASDLLQLSKLRPVSHFQPAGDLASLFLPPFNQASERRRPLLEVSVPLYRQGESRLLAIGQFVLEGESIATEFAALDANLFWLGLAAFLAGGSVVVGVLSLAFRQLQQVNRALAERTRSLLGANQELVLAAKTSAVGAVTSHLIHGLKNPLSGLQNFMTSRAAAPSEELDTEWRLAASSTQRMQDLVSDVVRVLREENGSADYEISLAELVHVISGKMGPRAKQAKVRFETRLNAQGVLTNRDANLIMLILENLIHNAIQATAKEKSVTLEVTAVEEQVVCEVRDQGDGLTEGYERVLFKPCQSTKEGGSGIGLAISKQLAYALGAELELKTSSPHGCVFALSVPKGLFVDEINRRPRAEVGRSQVPT